MRPDASNPAADFVVEWFKVPSDRATLDFPTVFTSSAWDPTRFIESVGELRATRVWVRGAPPLIQPLDAAPPVCGSPDKWVEGWPAGTPGLVLDPLSGVPLCCGPVAVPFAVATVFRAAEAEGRGAVAYVEGGASTLAFRQADVVGTAWGAAHVAGYIKPNAIAQVEGADAIAKTPKPHAVAYVEGADRFGKFIKPYAVAQVEGVEAFTPIIKPNAVISVWDADAEVTIFVQPDVVAAVWSAGETPPRTFPSIVAQVESNLLPETTGRMIVAGVAGVEAGPYRPSRQPVAQVEGTVGTFLPAAPSRVAQVEAVSSYDWVGRPGPVAIAWNVKGPGALVNAEALATVEAVAASWSRRFVAIASQVEGAAQVMQAVAKTPAAHVEGCKYSADVHRVGAAAQVEALAVVWSRLWKVAAAQVEGAAGVPKTGVKVPVAQVEGVSGAPRQVQKQGVGMVWRPHDGAPTHGPPP